MRHRRGGGYGDGLRLGHGVRAAADFGEAFDKDDEGSEKGQYYPDDSQRADLQARTQPPAVGCIFALLIIGGGDA